MKHQKDQHRHSHHPSNNRTDNDRNRRVNLPCLTDEEDDQIDSPNPHRTEHSSNEQQEVSVVAFAYAVVHEGAVMVEYLDAVVAGGAVRGTGWTVDFAGLAFFAFGVGVQIGFVGLVGQEFEDWSARDYAWVGAGG